MSVIGDTFQELSVLDYQHGKASILLAYVLAKQENVFDTAPLTGALARVADKWRLLGGRVQQDKENKKRFRICVLGGELVRKPAFKFTTATYNESFNSPPLIDICISSRPDPKYFSDPSTPSSLLSFATLDHPLLSVHVSHLNDATCIGITFPHGIFDAIGVGFILKALSAELAGREWIPPPLEPNNAVTTVFAELANAADATEKPVTPSVTFEKTWLSSSLILVLKFLLTVVYEYLFHKIILKNIYINEETMERMVSEVKGEIEAGESGKWVSTGDILTAWFLKAAMGDDKGLRDISVNHAISFRDLLNSMNPGFETRPHNSFVLAPMPSFTSSWLHDATIAEIALENRKHIELVRTKSFVQSLARYFYSLKGKTAFVSRLFNEPSFVLTNQVACRLTDIDFGPGTQLVAFWEWGSPLIPDNVIVINKLKGGYVITTTLRKSRWNSVEKEIKRIKSGGTFV